MTPPDRNAAARAIEDFLRAIGRDPARDPDLAGTGGRVADAYIDELCDGYAVDVPALLRSNVIGGTSELVSVRDIAVTTMCPHHLLPGEGRATVAFAPGEGGNGCRKLTPDPDHQTGAPLDRGKLEEARQVYEETISLAPKSGRCYRSLVNARRVVTGDHQRATMEQLARGTASLPLTDQTEPHVAFGKSYADLE